MPVIFAPTQTDHQLWNRCLDGLKLIKKAVADMSTDAFKLDCINAMAKDLRDDSGTNCRERASGVPVADYDQPPQLTVVTGIVTDYEEDKGINCT